MLKNISMKKEEEVQRKKLNRLDPHINRGFELMLRTHHRREKSSEPKSFHICFGKMLSLFRREIHLNFEFHLDIKKR
jgi:hypothetical protein